MLHPQKHIAILLLNTIYYCIQFSDFNKFLDLRSHHHNLVFLFLSIAVE